MEILQEMLRRHPGKIIGVILGLVFGWFAITYGLLKALFVLVCVVAGFYLGKRLDEKMDIRDMMSRLFRDRG